MSAEGRHTPFVIWVSRYAVGSVSPMYAVVYKLAFEA